MTQARYAFSQPEVGPPAFGPPDSGLSCDAASSWARRLAESEMRRHPLLADRWRYESGVVLSGLEHLWRLTGDERIWAFIKTNMDAFVGPDGAIRTYRAEEYNLDQINQGKLLFLLHRVTGDDRYRIVAGRLRAQLRTQPRTSEGGFWHKQIYPHQMWLDGVYMAGPFLAEYAIAFDESCGAG